MQRFILFFLRMLLALRYRVKVKGLKGIKADQGILFLANHPAEVDPLFLMTRLWNRFRVRPVAGDFLFHLPFVSWCVRQVDAIPVPAFDQSSNSFKQRRIEKVYEEAADHLKNKKNILIYPAGMLAITDHEVVGAASGVYELLQRVPDAKVVLVNTRGLWGSSFSKALTGKRPDIMPTFARGIKAVLKNLLFFTPRRHVTMEFKEDMNFPRKAEKLEMNRYLEKWFNRDGPEKLSLVSFSMWKEVLPTVEEKKSARKFSIDAIPQEVQERVLREIAELTNKREEDLLPEHDLSLDLGMDSLDKSQVSVMLREQFGVNQVNSSELTNILSVMSFAAHIEKSAVEEERAESKASLWGKEKGRPDPVYPEADTLIEGFLRTATKMDRYFAAADLMSGEVNYRRLKLGVVLFALYLKDLPGDKIGIMLPASIAVDISMLACQLVGKTPVMINWTLGPRNLQSVVEQTGIKHTLSSWKFLDRLNNVELGPLDDQLVLLEEVRGGLTLKQRLRALSLSRKSPEAILRAFNYSGKKDDPCVILFTSGTESFPKGVPLSNGNVMDNQRAASQRISLKASDVIVGVLPPFHSFGFSVTGMLPLLGGFRVAYSPNPTNGRQIAYTTEHWRGTLFCSAPTFLKTLLRVSNKAQMRTMRLIITGAERLPDELIEQMHKLNPKTSLIEGYGITECAPILTLNEPGKPCVGVGKAIPNVDIRILHPESMSVVSLGETGLIVARGPNVFDGYLSDERSPFVEFEGKRWYDTGDLGHLDGEGNLTIDGRLKRFVKIGGEMISLSMIEEILAGEAEKRGWKVAKDAPSFATIATETGESKSAIHLFTVCELSTDEVNSALKEAGVSNLIKVQSVNHLYTMPLLGSGKVDFRTLKSKLKVAR